MTEKEAILRKYGYSKSDCAQYIQALPELRTGVRLDGDKEINLNGGI